MPYGRRLTSSYLYSLLFWKSVECHRLWPKPVCDCTRIGITCNRPPPLIRSMPLVTLSKCLVQAFWDCGCNPTPSRREAWNCSCDVRRPRIDVYVRMSAAWRLGLDAIVTELCSCSETRNCRLTQLVCEFGRWQMNLNICRMEELVLGF
jgi:hypothetical protein